MRGFWVFFFFLMEKRGSLFGFHNEVVIRDAQERINIFDYEK